MNWSNEAQTCAVPRSALRATARPPARPLASLGCADLLAGSIIMRAFKPVAVSSIGAVLRHPGYLKRLAEPLEEEERAIHLGMREINGFAETRLRRVGIDHRDLDGQWRSRNAHARSAGHRGEQSIFASARRGRTVENQRRELEAVADRRAGGSWPFTRTRGSAVARGATSVRALTVC